MDDFEPLNIAQTEPEQKPHWRDQADGFADDDSELSPDLHVDAPGRQWSTLR